ncbi:MAG: SDR family NAD(P)-dependent oxidoreductase [Dehalococcoidia bacterium]|nr:SDR family NAD(P)-dependent oxidoreductase [Dehalococcoidia bacterium]
MILDQFALTDRIAIVTGSGRGIGRALAIGLAVAGVDIVVTSRNREQCEETVKMVREPGREQKGQRRWSVRSFSSLPTRPAS